MAKGSNNNLPAYTTVENLLKLIGVLKKSNKSEDSIKALFGLGDSAYTNTKSALKTFGIIETDCFDFTEAGREIAFSADENKKEEIIKIVKSYEPYELVLNSIITSQTDIDVTEIDIIKNLWGRADFGSGDRNRNDGATLFMSVIDYIGFGKYKIGRGSKPTRIEWIPDIKTKISSLNQEDHGVVQEENTKLQGTSLVEESAIDTVPTEGNEQKQNTPSNTFANEKIVEQPKKPISVVGLPNITINVDMSDWPDEKIKTFFKYAYGKFEED